MSRPFKLYRLQQIDSQLDWIHTRLLEIESALKEDAAVQEATHIIDQANASLQLARKALRQAEADVQDQRVKIEQNESSLYGGRIHNPKELKDLENDVAALKRYRSVLEDRQLEAMVAEEEAAEELRLASVGLEKARGEFDQRSQELVQEKERLAKEQARFEEERKATLGSIPHEDVALYASLRQKRRGVAVAKVTDRACSACGSTLNAILLDAARSPNQICVCDKCGRILYTG
jgi:predicted  nucleic acid-binding Zn-ribbon protein